MAQIRVGLIGVGNCASALVQGRFYYDNADSVIQGLITKNFDGYEASDIEFVAAYEADERKVGLDLSQAIFAKPNCTTVFFKDVPPLDCAVEMGYGGCILGSAQHDKLKDFLNIDDRYQIMLVLAIGKPAEKVVIEQVGAEGNIEYWRDNDGVHHVPKRALKDIILE